MFFFYCGKSDSLLISWTLFLLSLIIIRPSNTHVSLILPRRLRSCPILASRVRGRVKSSEINIGREEVKLASSTLSAVPDPLVSSVSFSSVAGAGFSRRFFSFITFALRWQMANRAIIALGRECWSGGWTPLGLRPTLWDISMSCSCTGGWSCICLLKSCSSSWSVSSSSDLGIPLFLGIISMLWNAHLLSLFNFQKCCFILYDVTADFIPYTLQEEYIISGVTLEWPTNPNTR